MAKYLENALIQSGFEAVDELHDYMRHARPIEMDKLQTLLCRARRVGVHGMDFRLYDANEQSVRVIVLSFASVSVPPKSHRPHDRSPYKEPGEIQR